MAAPWLILAGGTGGHVYPAQAVAELLKQRGVPFVWMGRVDGLERRAAADLGCVFLPVSAGPVRGRGVSGAVIGLVRTVGALFQAWVHIRRHRPAVVLSTGGYVSVAGSVAARLLGIPLCLHEQNAVPGLANRLLSRFASRVMVAFPDVFPNRPDAVITGNPVRPALSVSAAADRAEPAEPRLLVIGGSQGARILNHVVPAAVKLLTRRMKISVCHQSGPAAVDKVRAQYGDTGETSVQVHGFIDDMAAVYHWADIVVCRAGAITLAELGVVGLPAVLVPYAVAADDHQTANARYFLCRRCRRVPAGKPVDAEASGRSVASVAGSRSASFKHHG